jgi:purine-binding chemotaxis protein CheW
VSPSREQGPNREPAVQYCTFKVDHLLIGVEVWRVQEVIRHQPMTPVPLAPKEVKGLINLRGQIVTAIDVRLWLAMSPRPGDSLSMNAVIRLGDEPVSLLVDEAGEVVEPPLSSYEPVPSTASEQIRTLFSGTYKLEDALMLVLDTASVERISSDYGSEAGISSSRRAS